MMDPKVEAEYEEYKAAGRIWGVIDRKSIKKSISTGSKRNQ